MLARPALATAPGMPQTTLVAPSWAKTAPPAERMAREPASPSEPMPVRTTPSTRPAQTWRGGTEEDIDGGTAEVFRRILIEAEAHVAGEFEMPVAAGDVDNAGFGAIVGRGLTHAERAEAVEAFGKQAGKEARHVLHDEDGQREAGGNFGEDELRGQRAAGGDADDDHLGGREAQGARVGRGSGDGMAADGADVRGEEGEDFGKQVAGEGFNAFADAILGAGLGDVVGGAAGESFDGDAGAARGEGAAHDDGDAAIAAANAGEDLEAVHAGHFDVEQNEVGMEAFEGGEPASPLDGGGGDFDGGLRVRGPCAGGCA